MVKKYLTIDDLIEFCIQNNFAKFSSKESNAEICVQMPAVATFGKSDDNKHTEGLKPFVAAAYHDHVNLNKSNIEEDVFEENTQSIPYRPILANIVENADGNKDFGSHDFTVETDDDGNEKFIYQERPVGVIKKDYSIEYDKEAGVNRAMIQGYLWEGYCQDAVDIMERREKVDCSVELSIRELSFNAKDKVLNLDDYYVGGLTLLNENVGPGMAGSNVQLADFNSKTNSMYTDFDINSKLVETLEKINTTLSNFNINNAEGKEENQVNKFEELLQKYGKTVEDITFEYKDLSDEELESAFAEAFEENDPEPAADPAPDPEPENFVKSFELSHSDIRYALYNLLSAYEESDNEWYFINSVYDSHFTYENWDGDKIYGQNYTKDGDNVAFDGERYNLHRELLTDSEYTELQNMRSNYAAISEKLQKYEKAEEDANKDALFAMDDYKGIKETEEFTTLMNDHKEFTVDELKEKLDVILLSYAKAGKLNFAVVEELVDTKKPAAKVGLANVKSTQKKNKFGSLFSAK